MIKIAINCPNCLRILGIFRGFTRRSVNAKLRKCMRNHKKGCKFQPLRVTKQE